MSIPESPKTPVFTPPKLHQNRALSRPESPLSTITFEYCQTLNLASQQNHIPLIRQLQLQSSVSMADGGRLHLSTEPPCCEPIEIVLPALVSQETMTIQLPTITLNPQYFLALAEPIRGQWRLVWRDAAQQREVTIQHYPLDLLPADIWGGERNPLELLAAYVQPNHRVVAQLLHQAAQQLQQQGGSGLSGYQSRDRQAVRQQITAIWQQVAALQLQYVPNPASFVARGQKIRLPHQIMAERLACCLDSSLLLAALFEQAGLHAQLLLSQGHAYVGVWTVESPCVDVLLDDLQALRKRVDIGNFLVLESTVLTQSHPTLEAAILAARSQMNDEHDFIAAIDLPEARRRGIRPLAFNLASVIDPMAQTDAPASITTEDRLFTPVADMPIVTAKTRVDQWLRRLLDLSLRNRLLNFKDSRTSIPLFCPADQIAGLEDALAAGQVFRFCSHQQLEQVDLQRTDEQQWRAQYARENLKQQRLYALLDETALTHHLVELFREARTAQEEGGANTLFLAMGFLEWREHAKAERVYRAPLLLIPIRLNRESARAGFSIQIFDEEPRFNETLLQMLKQDFDVQIAGVDPIPMDESGVDVALVLHRVREAILGQSGWEVVDDCALGLFSFAKYLMWRDLSERLDDLRQHPVVRHLIDSPRERFMSQAAFPDPRQLDQVYSPTRVFTPLSADSSQLAAVMAATEGRHFVLSGPPGTGKSQTITNMIAQCLADGQRVLFVSEKMAALDVVHRRLSQIGLGTLCLQLHSAKAQKMVVLDQFRERLTASTSESEGTQTDQMSQVWQQVSDALMSDRQQLNTYVAQLHQQHPIGWSAYHAMSVQIGQQDQPRIALPAIDVMHLDQQGVQACLRLADQLAVLIQPIWPLQQHPLSGFATDGQQVWSPIWQNQYITQLQTWPKLLGELQQVLQRQFAHLGLQAAKTWAELTQQVHIVKQIYLFRQAHGALMCQRMTQLVHLPDLGQFDQVQQLALDIQANQAKLHAHYQPEIYPQLAMIQQRFREASAKLWPWSWFAMFQLRGVVATYSVQGQRLRRDQVWQDVQILQQIHQQQADFDRLTQGYAQHLNTDWQGLSSDWLALQSAVQAWHTLQYLADQLGFDPERLLQHVTVLAAEGEQSLHAAWEPLQQLWQQLGNDVLLEAPDCHRADQPLTMILQRMQRLLDQRQHWRAGLNYQSVRYQAVQLGLTPMVIALEQAGIRPQQLQQVVALNLKQDWLEHFLQRAPDLARFNASLHQQLIQDFQQVDQRHMQLAIQQIHARCPLPDPTDPTLQSEWRVLNRELAKKRRHIPVRELLKQTPNLWPALKPCVLMSPLSVAQYLAADQTPFDVVIFDEASQIPVWDAIGALARGKQSIIVGDNKQMPPTSFFGRVEVEDEFEEVEQTEDLESILDECLAAQLPERILNWHYRSRFESLIHFSNQRYYDGKLFTFPAPVTPDRAVQYHAVAGFYDKGKSRTNRAE
ncbi:MAG: DUF4011 domain-containing protein, partial [Pseudomonadota bacterium]|nr:DUF4011 domain-containing protein [Pseudomonadota bacterium]